MRIHGKRNGLLTEFYEKGGVKSEYNYNNDMLDGEFKLYYSNGIVKAKGNMKNGQQKGKYIEFDDSGKQIKETQFD